MASRLRRSIALLLLAALSAGCGATRDTTRPAPSLFGIQTTTRCLTRHHFAVNHPFSGPAFDAETGSHSATLEFFSTPAQAREERLASADGVALALATAYRNVLVFFNPPARLTRMLMAPCFRVDTLVPPSQVMVGLPPIELDRSARAAAPLPTTAAPWRTLTTRSATGYVTLDARVDNTLHALGFRLAGTARAALRGQASAACARFISPPPPRVGTNAAEPKVPRIPVVRFESRLPAAYGLEMPKGCTNAAPAFVSVEVQSDPGASFRLTVIGR